MASNDSANEIKHKIINNSLLFGVIVGFIIFIIRIAFTTDNNTALRFIIDMVSISGLFGLWYYRHKLSLKLKSFLIITVVFALWTHGVFHYGYLSHNTLLFIILPLFLGLSVSNRLSLLFSAIFIAVYLGIAFAYTSNIIALDANPLDRIGNMFHWLMQLLFLVIISFIAVIILNSYKGYYNKLVNKLEIQNNELNKHKEQLSQLVDERTEKLNQANAKLISTNKELESKNEVINNQNSELKKALQSLKETQSQLIQVEKMASLGTLTAGIAHEINNPLNYIMGSSVGLKDYFDEHGSADSSKTELFLKGINTGIGRVSDILSGLDQLSRNNSNLDEECHIHSILDNCLLMLQNQYKHKAEVIKNYSENAITVKGNVGQLHQVFINILTNAIQAINNNGIIELTTRIEEETIVIETIDNGIGISEENIGEVTDPFYTTKSPGEGTGLGLSISYSIIQNHGGTLEVDSVLNKGTTIIIKLPNHN